MLFKVIGVGLVCVVLTLVLKQYKPEFAILVSVCGALLIFFMVCVSFQEIINNFFSLSSIAGINGDLLTPIIKVIGVGYITEFVSDIAEDAGNKLLSNKILSGGKIAVLITAIPIVENLISLIVGMIL